MLAPPTAGHFPNSPYFAIPLVSLIQPLTTFLEEKKSFNLQFDFMLTLQHKQQRALLFAWKLHKELHPSAVKNQTLDQPYTPGIQPDRRLPKCIPTDSPVPVQQADAQLEGTVR